MPPFRRRARASGKIMTKRLIINSDDYGRTADISRGIRESHLHGVVTSTTCMMNIRTTPADIALALQETPKLGLGVHLVLTAERPLLSRERLQTITNEDGSFLKLAMLISQIDQIEVNEVKTEWHAQVDLFVKTAGKKPTHLDSHHHSSYFSPALFRAMLELAKEYECAIRLPVVYGSDEMAGLPSELIGPIKEYAPKLLSEFNPRRPNAFFASFYDDLATPEELNKIFAEINQDGTFEIMCHPGYVDDAFAKESSYNKQRETELEILTTPSIKRAIQANGIDLITFAEL
jgi:chitin disaccharide deacetylase